MGTMAAAVAPAAAACGAKPDHEASAGLGEADLVPIAGNRLQGVIITT
jgi:hypothetical protein